jgi:hypothetical protein
MFRYKLRTLLILLVTGLASVPAWAFMAVVFVAAVRFAHLVLLYGFRRVSSGEIFFESVKPALVVSNGDTLSGFQAGLQFLVIAGLWLAGSLGATIVIFRVVRQMLGGSSNT